ncbi:MAG: hypothetical protein ACI9SY_000640, partial [Candidatus Paceibacteria bacterium]
GATICVTFISGNDVVLSTGGTRNGNRLKTFFQRHDNGKQLQPPKLRPATSAQQKVNAELAARLERLRSEGVVDVKVFANSSKRSSAQDMRWVLNNVLRHYEEGHYETTVFSSVNSHRD